MVFRFFFLLFPLTLLAAPGYTPPWGKDAPLDFKEVRKDPLPEKRVDPLGLGADNIILFYQNHISPLHGGRSHFRPTSSHYMLSAIRRYGFLTGYIMGCDRLLRENKEVWVYRSRVIDKKLYKWDPTIN